MLLAEKFLLKKKRLNCNDPIKLDSLTIDIDRPDQLRVFTNAVMTQILCTVGTTKFDFLISTISSPEFLSFIFDNFDEFPIKRLVIQHGTSPLNKEYNRAINQSKWPGLVDLKYFDHEALSLKKDLKCGIDCYSYKKSLNQDMLASDIIVCSGGSGTILECLEMGKKVLVIPNPTLQDNHQFELVEALASQGKISYVKDLHHSPKELYSSIRAMAAKKAVSWEPPTVNLKEVMRSLLQ